VVVFPENALMSSASTGIDRPNALPVRFLQASQWQASTYKNRLIEKRTAPQEHPPS
jgi:hypothetical protein